MEGQYLKEAHLDVKRRFSEAGYTQNYSYRRAMLATLKAAIKEHEDKILEALREDLGKHPFEAYASEIGFVYAEINHAIRHLKKWMKPKRVPTPLVQLPSSSRIYPVPKGTVLIISPWNYPFQLIIAPLVAAMAGGNSVVLKPSELAPATARALQDCLEGSFTHEFLSVVQGPGHEAVPELIRGGNFDHIFFTGSVPVGKHIALYAAEVHSPVTLELGGKSPAVVHRDAHIESAAKRIIHGKTLNAGQTCVAPDYLLVHRSAKNELISAMKQELEAMYPGGTEGSPSYGKIINERRFDTLVSYLSQGDVVSGGEHHRDTRYIAPTIMENCGDDSPLMTDEIFGPILPVIEYQDVDEVFSHIGKRPNPLALYLFTRDRDLERRIINRIPFGGGCVNDTLMHLVNPALPFGGVRSSGSGVYHGKYGFDAMTHPKAIIKTPVWHNIKLKYPPYGERGFKLIKKVFS